MPAQNCCISPAQHFITIYLSLNSAAFLSLHFPSPHSRFEGVGATSTMKPCCIDWYKYEDVVLMKMCACMRVNQREKEREAEEYL